MRVAFYAPLKPPDHPVPSGDRRMARLLIDALRLAGHEVEVPARLRSRDGIGDPARQERLARLGQDLGARLIRRYHARPAAARPAAWLTYHLYYKAPDWIGPQAAAALEIPYLVAEASVANKRADGPWAAGHRAVLAALDRAAAVIALNPADVPALPDPARVHVMAPFLDPTPFRAAAARRDSARAALARAHDLDMGTPWLLAVAMMRPGDKLASYALLAEALRRVADRDWRLLVVGEGPARAEVHAALAWAGRRVRWLGEQPPERLPELYAACDLLVWPALNEAYGMALLEAQAAGLPVLAGASGGVAAVVPDGIGGKLVPPGDAGAFADALASLLDSAEARHALGLGAAKAAAAAHGIEGAAARLDAILRQAVAR